VFQSFVHDILDLFFQITRIDIDEDINIAILVEIIPRYTSEEDGSPDEELFG
jgi:hypothetical protein